MSDLVICWHANCSDGRGASWWLGKHAPPHDGEIRYVACNWNDPLPDDIDGAVLWCVDYCFQTPQLEAARKRCAGLVVLDHHETSLGWLQASTLNLYERVEDFLAAPFQPFVACLDQTHSGAGLAAAVVKHNVGIDPPEFLLDIEDRDLWRFSRATTKDVFASVTSLPQTIEAWDGLEEMSYYDLMLEGQAINRYRDKLISDILETAYEIYLGGEWYPCVDSPYAVASDVAGILAERYDGIALYVIHYGDKTRFGVRSTDGRARLLAETFGGGGHGPAAGFEIKHLTGPDGLRRPLRV